MGISMKRLAIDHHEGGCSCCELPSTFKLWLGSEQCSQMVRLCDKHAKDLRTLLTTMTSPQPIKPIDIRCPMCGAPPGTACYRPDGSIGLPHNARVEAAREGDQALR